MLDSLLFKEIKEYILGYLRERNESGVFSEIMTDDAFVTNKVFVCYPALFADALKMDNQSGLIKQITAAGYIYFYSLLKVDEALDDPGKNADKKSLIFIFRAHEETLKILCDIFNSNSVFWTQWNEKHNTYYSNSIAEAEAFKTKKRLSLMEYEKIAVSRNGLGLIALDCIYQLLDKRESGLYSKLVSIHENFAIAYQVLDDLHDIREDYSNGQINFVVNCLNTTGGIENSLKEFYLKGAYKKVYNYALSKIDKAIVIAKKIGAAFWIRALQGFRKAIDEEFYNMTGFMKVSHARAKLLTPPGRITSYSLPVMKYYKSDFEKVKYQAFAYLLSQKNLNFGELKHIMFLNRNIGLLSTKEIHINDTFQRAIIADIFCDCRKRFNFDFEDLLSGELAYLKKKVKRDQTGGWSYYPSIPEVAADADDLGQILQLFVRLGERESIGAFFNKPISVLLKDRMHQDGGIETWIIPKDSVQAEHKRQETYNAIWGSGPDAEVMANFLYGLCLYDYNKYKKEINRGAKYLINRMEKEGYWKSKWYYGPYYGTYICILFFGLLEKNTSPGKSAFLDKAFNKSEMFLTKNQNSDGGWGMNNNKSDLLSTSLVILALSGIYHSTTASTRIMDSLRSGVIYLIKSWDLSAFDIYRIPFIMFRMKDPYSSKTLTVGYVLKAILSAEQLYKGELLKQKN
jgi:squalene-hopene/tetraprenyl-beta-curcumene cyclase